MYLQNVFLAPSVKLGAIFVYYKIIKIIGGL